jgi:hypothetical protein
MIMLKVTYKSGDPEWFTNKIRKKLKKLPHMMVDCILKEYQRKER